MAGDRAVVMLPFDALVLEMAESHGAERGTMMGLPCLRIAGVFFASADRETGALIVKLPKDRVRELIEAGEGEPFAPNGRTFKEWVSISGREAGRWRVLAEEALSFVAASNKG